MLPPSLAKNNRLANIVIYSLSIIVFVVVVILSRVKLQVNLGFDVHIFAKINAVLNTLVAIFLVAALVAVRNKKYELHKKIMLTAIVLSALFLVSYIAHHLLAGDTKYGDTNLDGLLSDAEKLAVSGTARMVYYIILGTHILLAAIILPFILFTAYRALTAEYAAHKKLARITWPIWFYVAVTGPIVYLMISPFYN
jgi:putative membrane protein